MMFDGINLLGVLGATVVSFVFGAAWYSALGKPWMKAAGLTEEDTKPSPVVMAMAVASQFVMAFVLAGVIYHTGEITIKAGVISALMVWVGFIVTSQIVNHRFQGKPWSLTLIDCGHWLGVLLLQGIVIGWVG